MNFMLYIFHTIVLHKFIPN